MTEMLETLDRRNAHPAVVRATLADIARSNRLFGGRRAVRWGVERLLRAARPSGRLTVLDVGAGSGDVARYLARSLGARWALRIVALDHLTPAARLCRERGLATVVGDFAALPFGGRAVDVVVASQVLHHVPRSRVPPLLRALGACARVGVVVADLRRSRAARAGIWGASHLLGFHPVTRRDGIVSVSRGFAVEELERLCRDAGVVTRVYRRPGWRLVAWWRC
jgi:SAM-dependent methyltransferase